MLNSEKNTNELVENESLQSHSKDSTGQQKSYSEASDLNRGRVRPLVVLAFEIAV